MAKTSDVGAATQGRPVTKSDTTVLPVTRALYIGGAGDVAVVHADGGAAVTYSAMAAGQIYPLQVTKVMSTNTTATNIVALY